MIEARVARNARFNGFAVPPVGERAPAISPFASRASIMRRDFIEKARTRYDQGTINTETDSGRARELNAETCMG